MGSTAIGIPTGALIASSPFEILVYFGVGSYGDNARDIDGDGEVIGNMHERIEVFLLLFFFFFLETVFFWIFLG